MAQLGSGALIIALALAIYGIIAGVIGARRNVPELVDSAVRAVWGVTALILVAVGSLIASPICFSPWSTAKILIGM